jgi:hypothetical protein
MTPLPLYLRVSRDSNQRTPALHRWAVVLSSVRMNEFEPLGGL